MTDAYSVDVRVTAPVNPTELEDRVADAIQTLFPGAEVETQGSRVVAETHTVEDFRERLFEQRILDTARKQFAANQTEDGFSFDLKKQAAFNGTVNFAVGNPDELGDLHVEVTVREPAVDQFVDYLAPKTEDGEPLEEP
ncbi:RNA-binding domain-containing protein [Halobacterium jilantaiense]|uniref:UPF0201 protein SAMN04487945_1772 n=1 Tax=Halobacterium jilantaiense TaxID=355548 RepID=A0A1I0PL34_9EURY|nr:RNA-binding domain-containing protein [Halobacterium jilantaiense]SEW15039.1 hypothetical protein SAMN04487945_1772 [Halobacterium jilantaiense]